MSISRSHKAFKWMVGIFEKSLKLISEKSYLKIATALVNELDLIYTISTPKGPILIKCLSETVRIRARDMLMREPDTSSVVAEAMQFGMISFSFDLPHVQAANIDREYPGLTINSLEDAIDRIKKIEAGKWHYPIEDFQEFVDMSGMVFFDRVRRDMGFTPREPSIPLLGGGPSASLADAPRAREKRP